jgi:hypothetical protein
MRSGSGCAQQMDVHLSVLSWHASWSLLMAGSIGGIVFREAAAVVTR